MEDFNKKIQVKNQGMLNFYFSDVSSVLSPHFRVTVNDKEGKLYLFEMRKKKGEWKIVSQAPDWVASVESQLAVAIINQYCIL